MKTPCPRCNSLHTRKNGRTKAGKQMYQCLDCRRHWTADPSVPFSNDSLILCPRCNSHSIRKDGYSEAGKQRYFCKDCSYKFVEELNNATTIRKARPISPKEASAILMYHYNLRIPARELARSFDKPINEVERLISLHKPTRTGYNTTTIQKLIKQEELNDDDLLHFRHSTRAIKPIR